MKRTLIKSSSRDCSPAIAIAIVLCLLTSVALVATAAQRRQQTLPATRATDYSKFLHSTAKHKQACNTCHKIPTRNSQKVRGYPDTADYPDHEACVSCHRAQFFKGDRPLICTVCHTRVSPREDARLPFRKPDMLRQFSIIFPHDKHQDVIARFRDDAPARFVRASFIGPADQVKTYNNCAICHLTWPGVPAAPASGWLDNFSPPAATFKSSPANHASCFNCHWKSQQPVNNNCAGCHLLADKPLPSDMLPRRISMKFRHEREQHIAECTTCHINITKSASLRGLKPDVPITSCTECHNKDGLRLDVSKELEAIDKNRDFVCVYCHTSDVGRLDPPPGHYLIAGRTSVKRKDIK
jgi:Class III cytochrome C family